MGHRDAAVNRSKRGRDPSDNRSSQPNSLSPQRSRASRQRSPKEGIAWAIAVLLIAIGGIAGSGWVAIQLIVNPQALGWMNRFLPDWVPIPVTGLQPPQTLEAIQAKIRQTGKIPGELLPLGKNKSLMDGKVVASDFLMPLLAQPSDPSDRPPAIVELRVYQGVSGERQKANQPALFQLVKQVAIVGPQESFVLAPLVNAQSTSQGTARALPLTSLKRFEGKVPSQGIWLNLSGLWSRRNETVTYGQIVHYNPKRFYLSVLLEWSSTTGQIPLWQEITGSGTPELMINQTIGMEPQFKVYQVQPRSFLPNPIYLEPISLTEPALNNPTYGKALILARNGLWSTGWKWLHSFKQKQGGKNGKWSATMQAQMDLVHLHAQITQTHAEQSWASPNQQVLANLIDGRWSRALSIFKESAENSLETAALLKADSGQLRNRVNAALQISPNQLDVKTWGALLIASQRGQAAAIAWLRKQPKTTTSDISQISQLLKRLQPAEE
ncbi:hypothetical protein K9N68_07535 [Kovacikia minuta CCNUW1]|uniref:hypothetical protein n=1 Tax=Kovacikia minuta TaxID=2931930 RepID=UPI001CCFDCED|nr:hypothetical protein [Kovacikia minuta]UBF27756.1 hypothetical protein K9N68_07535 [Kovacikia minuta CCNUW1]